MTKRSKSIGQQQQLIAKYIFSNKEKNNILIFVYSTMKITYIISSRKKLLHLRANLTQDTHQLLFPKKKYIKGDFLNISFEDDMLLTSCRYTLTSLVTP